MKLCLIFIVVALVLALAGCRRHGDGDIGGAVPMLATDWSGLPYADGAALLFFDYADIVEGGIREREILAVIGDDHPVPHEIVAYMLSIINEPWQGSGMLTLKDASNIVQDLNPSGKVIYITEENQDQYISYALWVELYIEILEYRGEVGIMTANIVPLGGERGNVLTNIGTFGGKQINLTAYMNKEVAVLHRNNDIVAVLGITDFEPVMRGMIITHADAFGVTMAIGGGNASRNFVYAAGVEPIEWDGEGSNITIANVTIRGTEIIEIAGTDAMISGTIERVRRYAIDLMEWGSVPLCAHATVYDMSHNILGPESLIVGENMADFYVINGRIAAVVITRDVSPASIRVVIGTCHFGGLVHESVRITSDGTFLVRGGDDNKVFSAGDIFTVSAAENGDLWGGMRLYVAPIDMYAHRLEIVGLGRAWADGAYPRYRGVLEISRYNGGTPDGFVIVNELCIEQYLFAVIPSEMPTAHGLEAAKVQAITARSFAIHQFYQNAFREFGAHVDDSVISQVYNNIPETDISIAAVNATRGQVLSRDGEMLIANYFSTSSGMTANFGEVWAQGSLFPSYTAPHLVSRPQFYDSGFDPGDLTCELAASVFFRNSDVPGLDRNFPWFRWNVELTAAELTASINASIAERLAANRNMIHIFSPAPVGGNITQQLTGNTVAQFKQAGFVQIALPATGIGQLLNMEVTRRGQGGNIMEMIFYGTDAIAVVQTEFNIRSLLNPGRVAVLRHDGTQAQNLRLLPSAFFAMDVERGANGYLLAVILHGGGNGHGVGMSQNAVRTLVEMGYTYRDILLHFYPGVEVVGL